MNKTHYIFSYGTLTDKEIQQALFKRKLKEIPDQLTGFRIAERKMYGQYLVVERTGDLKDSISGSALVLKEEELPIADAYEGESYKRILVKLKSGINAWVYVETGTQ
ncbi:gamma-glutamylcyclotransferase [Zeaxanthinibacter sp. PT1]|uniref:gamma-glutamylcyclotransferase family protein n=1 Tax=Zeaxanthinibacter TaxID=561554 RepID=UPI002349B0E0|nr:gamma-glutamylcyclotransferase family protein [Zeaxanthinibacter sp. PT1]MDC6350311.1 gamma-glutamylcyclotransferase [Zeaxanthinibacter sp. PT1]